VADDEDRDLGDGALTGGYERLRAAVLSGDSGGWRLGHGVLSARGMCAWMSTFDSLATPSLPEGGDAAAALAPAQMFPAREADEVVAVLAQMVLPLAA